MDLSREHAQRLDALSKPILADPVEQWSDDREPPWNGPALITQFSPFALGQLQSALGGTGGGAWVSYVIDMQPVVDAVNIVATELQRTNLLLESLEDVLRNPSATAAEELHARGVSAFRSGWFDEARADLVRAIEINPYRPASHMTLGFVNLARQDYLAADTNFVKALRYATAGEHALGLQAALTGARLRIAAEAADQAAALLEQASNELPYSAWIEVARARIATRAAIETLQEHNAPPEVVACLTAAGLVDAADYADEVSAEHRRYWTPEVAKPWRLALNRLAREIGTAPLGSQPSFDDVVSFAGEGAARSRELPTEAQTLLATLSAGMFPGTRVAFELPSTPREFIDLIPPTPLQRPGLRPAGEPDISTATIL